MKKSGESARKIKLKPIDLDLELPDFSGMRDTSACVSADAAYKLCEEYAAIFHVPVRNYREQNRHRCEVEFVL